MPRLNAKIMFGLSVGFVSAILYMLLLPLLPLGMEAGGQDTLLVFLLGAAGGLWIMVRRQQRRPPTKYPCDERGSEHSGPGCGDGDRRYCFGNRAGCACCRVDDRQNSLAQRGNRHCYLVDYHCAAGSEGPKPDLRGLPTSE